MSNWGSELLKALKDKGYVQVNNTLYPPTQAELMNIPKPKKKKAARGIKTGWIDDYRNIKSRGLRDEFIQLVEQTFHVEVWPEFFFMADRGFRFDYAIPITLNSVELKIAIESEGGIWRKGGGAHSRPTGILRDIEKYNNADALDWNVIRVVPKDLLTTKTLDRIKYHLDKLTL